MGNNKDWANKMLELDIKAQEGAIWTSIKSKEKPNSKKYVVKDDVPLILKPDPVYYGNKPINDNPEILTSEKT